MGRMRASILRPRTPVSESYHAICTMYLVVLVAVLFSTSTSDPPPDDEDYGSGSGSGSGSDSNFSFISETTSSSMSEIVANACDTDQLEVTTYPVHINAFTHETYCSLLVNTPNNTAISVSILESDLNNVHTYFYIEMLENQMPNNPKRISLFTLDHTPCVAIIQGNQFRFHFQNTNMTVVICTKEVEKSVCYETVSPLIETTQCGITLYQSKIQTSRMRKTFRYGWWSYESISLIVTHYQAKCTCDCPDTCTCTLAYRQWLSVCINSQGSNTTSADLIVYKPTTERLSFANTGLNEIQHNAFIGLKGLKVLILSHNSLLMLQPSLCQNLPKLQVLQLDHNKLVNLTSDSFTGPCDQKLKMLYLQSNELTYLPHDLFNSTTKLRYVDLTQNRLKQISRDLFKSLKSLQILYLSGNAIANLPVGVFDSLGELFFLDLSGNAISNLTVGVFDSLGLLTILDLSGNVISNLTVGVFGSLCWLHTLDLSGNGISNLTVGVFDSLGELRKLDLSGNAISNLPVGVLDSLGRMLLTLDLSGNGISNLTVGVFDSLYRLCSLDLSDNNILFLPNSVFVSAGQRFLFYHESFPGLKTLNLSGNNISKLNANVFESLTGLFTLAISHNSLYTLPRGVFNSLQELKTLDLSNNRMELLLSTAFDSQQHLLTLDLSNNKLFSLPGGLFLKPSKLISLNLCCNNLTTISASEIFESLTLLKILDMSKNSIEQLPQHLFESTSNLLSLEISDNKLSIIPDTLFRNLSKLTHLNMSKNFLSRLPSFNAQEQLQILDVSENQLCTLKLVTFENLKNLILLSMAKNFITALHSHLFFNLDNTELFNASYNAIQKIDSNVVSAETKLKTIDLRGNEMYKVTPNSFTSLTNSTILVDKHATCCFLNEDKCISMTPRPEYLTCNRMLQDVVLRISVWVLGLSAFICNVIAYCVRSRNRKANKVQTLLISHLALSDLLIGINMLILAIADVYYNQYFPSYAHGWRHGFTCKFAGFLSILSSEGSVFFITLISIDRMLGIKYPFGGHRLETKSARICVALAWLMALSVSVIPISLASDNGNFYSISEVCIGIPIVRRHLTTLMNTSTEIKTSAVSSSPEFFVSYSHIRQSISSERYRYVKDVSVMHQESAQNITYTIAENGGSQVTSIYAIVVFISVNLCCFVIVACCYIYIFIKAASSAEGVSRSQTPQQARDEDLRMARKMFAIVFTDFCCWVPLSLVCILTQSGVIEVSPEMYAWTVGFILPINSSINPFLYVLYEAISDHLKKKREEKKDREDIEMQVRWKPLKYFGLRFDETRL